MITRLRELPDLHELYKTPHDHTQWPDHEVRVRATVSLGSSAVGSHTQIIDLSCGNGYIATELAKLSSLPPILGDFAPGYPICGPIEQTIDVARRIFEDGPGCGLAPPLFILTEILEHLDDPIGTLQEIGSAFDEVELLLSTPNGETTDGNPEHVWGWDDEGIREVLGSAGFHPEEYVDLDLGPLGYPRFQIWKAWSDNYLPLPTELEAYLDGKW